MGSRGTFGFDAGFEQLNSSAGQRYLQIKKYRGGKWSTSESQKSCGRADRPAADCGLNHVDIVSAVCIAVDHASHGSHEITSEPEKIGSCFHRIISQLRNGINTDRLDRGIQS